MARRFLPLLLAIVVTLTWAAWMIKTGIALSGRFTYPLDDAYIHLTMADQVLRHGVWGVSSGVPTSASSSPLFTILLVIGTAVRLPFEWVPLIVNIAAAIALLAAADALLRDAYVPPWLRGLGLLVLVAIIPLPSLLVTGMEHVLHGALCLVFLLALRRIDQARWRRVAVGLAAILPMVRFESMLLVGAASFVLFAKHRRDAVMLTATAIASVATFVALSVAGGLMWLPNSVLLKGSGQQLLQGLLHPQLLSVWFYSRGALTALAAGLALLRLGRRLPFALGAEAAIVSLTVLAQVSASFGRLMSFDRYESFLYPIVVAAFVSSGWVAMRSLAAQSLSLAHLVMAAAITLPVQAYFSAQDRVIEIASNTPYAMRNITDQQRETARFVREFLTVPGPVVINDLGLVALEGGRPVIDIVGIGDTAIARHWLARDLSREVVEQHARDEGAAVAAVYDDWLAYPSGAPGAPASWIRIGKWTIDHNWICGKSDVTVYAIDREHADAVRRDFVAFSRTLASRSSAVIF